MSSQTRQDPVDGAGAATLAGAKALSPLIRSSLEEIDKMRSLPPVIVAGLRQAGVFRMWTPREWGGPELDPVQQFAVLEELSRSDGSVGWNAGVTSTTAFFTSFLDQDVARAMYPTLDVATGGTAVPTGKAEIVEDGYRITGRWAFGSGVSHSDYMICPALVHQDGKPLQRENGEPELVMAFVAAGDFKIIDTWNAMGLRGSGSHDYAVDGLIVPRERTFDLFGSPSHRSEPLYQMRNMFEFIHAAVALGIARAAIDAFTDLALAKRSPWGPVHEQAYARTALARAEAVVQAARGYCLSTLGDIYATLAGGRGLSVEQRAAFRLSITHAHRAAVEAVDGVFEAAGSTAAVRLPSVLERCFRDVHTANQHIIASPHTFEVIGGMMLGSMPKEPTY